MSAERIVIGQQVNPAKKQLAKELRQKMTPEEKILWHYLRDGKLGFKFRRQQVIEGFIIDYYCHEVGLILEIDGGIHETQKDYDAKRDQILQNRNMHVLRITNQELQTNRYQTIALIRNTCLKLAELQR